MNFLKNLFLFVRFLSKLKVKQKGKVTVLKYGNLQLSVQAAELQLRFKGLLLIDPMFYSICAEHSLSNSILNEDYERAVELYREVVNLNGQERDEAYQEIYDRSHARYNSNIEKSGTGERSEPERVN
jgi:hypothetical protein